MYSFGPIHMDEQKQNDQLETTYIYADKVCSLEDPQETMDDREGRRESVRDIRADGATWWWWWLASFISLQL